MLQYVLICLIDIWESTLLLKNITECLTFCTGPMVSLFGFTPISSTTVDDRQHESPVATPEGPIFQPGVTRPTAGAAQQIDRRSSLVSILENRIADTRGWFLCDDTDVVRQNHEWLLNLWPWFCQFMKKQLESVVPHAERDHEYKCTWSITRKRCENGANRPFKYRHHKFTTLHKTSYRSYQSRLRCSWTHFLQRAQNIWRATLVARSRHSGNEARRRKIFKILTPRTHTTRYIFYACSVLVTSQPQDSHRHTFRQANHCQDDCNAFIDGT